MLQRTKGRILLALLVITGMAGTVKNSTLSQKERKFCVSNLKETRNELVRSVKELSPAQLDFRPAPGKWNIREYLYHIAMAENFFNDMLKTAMKQPARPEKRQEIKINDTELMQTAANCKQPLKTPDALQPAKANWESPAEAIAAFRTARTEHLRYVRNTTEDLRNHVTQLHEEAVDCYQLILFMTAHSQHHLQQIKEIMADEDFPQ
ncbi:MAG: DinB family protein [Chitinophagaceae bacterium]